MTTKQERAAWLSALRSGKPLGRKTLEELADILEGLWRREDGKRGRPRKTAWERAERNLDSGGLAREVAAEMKTGLSRAAAIKAVAAVAKQSPGALKKRLEEIKRARPSPVSLARGGARADAAVVDGSGSVTDTNPDKSR